MPPSLLRYKTSQILRYVHSTSICYARQTYYQVLGVNSTATSNEIREAFFKKSKQYHPDSSGTTNTSDKFVELNEAYSVLVKPHSRRAYDEQLKFGEFHAHRGWGGAGTADTHHHGHSSGRPFYQTSSSHYHTHGDYNHWREWGDSPASHGGRGLVKPHIATLFLTFAAIVVFLRFYVSYITYTSDNKRMKLLVESQRNFQNKKDTPEYLKIRSELNKFYEKSTDTDMEKAMESVRDRGTERGSASDNILRRYH